MVVLDFTLDIMRGIAAAAVSGFAFVTANVNANAFARHGLARG